MTVLLDPEYHDNDEDPLAVDVSAKRSPASSVEKMETADVGAEIVDGKIGSRKTRRSVLS